MYVDYMYIVEQMGGAPLAEALTMDEAITMMGVLGGHRVVSMDDGSVMIVFRGNMSADRILAMPPKAAIKAHA